MKKFVVYVCLIFLVVCSSFAYGCGGCSGCAKNDNSTQYDITCELENNLLTANQKVTFYNSFENSVKQLKFNLFANAFRKDAKYSPIQPQYTSICYPNGINYGQMQINSCLQEGKALQYEICGDDQNILLVNLLEEVFPTQKVTIEINFVVTLANVVSRTGVNQKTINLGNFYPILCGYDNGFYECVYYGIGDPFYSDIANYKVSITTDKDFVICGGGKKVKEVIQNTKKTSVFVLEQARSFAMVLSKNFKTISSTVHGVAITYYYYEDEAPEQTLEYANKAIKFFSEKFGKYPYKNYSFAQTQFAQGGMEYPTITLISDSLEKASFGEVVVHETAHQWWQTVVGNNEVEYGFLDEGLAEYSVVLFYENFPEYELTRKQMIGSCENSYRVFCSVIDKIEGKVNTTMVRSLGEFTSEYEYVNLAYVKPCIMYDYLRETIGDQRFFEGLRNYYSEYAFKNAEPNDIVGVYERLGADANGFFDSFYNGKVII